MEGTGGARPLPPRQNAVGVAEDGEGAAECRICKGGESDGALFRSCMCRGSLEFVHPACLQRWLEARTGGGGLRAREGEVVNSIILCEVCHSPYTIKVHMRTEWKVERLCASRSIESYVEGVCLVSTLFVLSAMSVVIWTTMSVAEKRLLRENWPLVTSSALSMLLMATLALRKVFLRWRRAQLAPTISPISAV